ncbi:signal peptidase II [Rothia sp. P5766]|uniref:signal peptidase II n=1 Tax=Rothia sp. P5766 TaxID=3402656 RepID=UPI003AEEC5AA
MAQSLNENTRLVPVRTVSGVAKAVLVWVLFAVVYGADQWVKHIVESTMLPGESITVIDGLLWWRFYLNSGAAFSMGENSTWIFTVISTVGAIVTSVLIVRSRALVWTILLAILAGGIVGNLHDRLFREPGFGRGHVVDYISVPNFAIFNIADAAICMSMACIVLLTFLGYRLDGQREISATTVQGKKEEA